MTIRNLSKQDVMLSYESTPLCVVGGGIAGLLLAYRVAKAGRRVLLVESGDTSFDDEIHRLNEIESTKDRYSRALDGRFRGLGGSSSRWGGRMIPINAREREDRPYLGLDAWPLPVGQLDSYWDELQALFQIDDGAFDDISIGMLDGKHVFPDEDEDVATRWAKCPRHRLCNVATVLGAQLRELKNLEIWLGATVCDFELDRAAARLRGITARSLNGKTLKVKADEFVVAAGTIETTRLLLLIDRLSADRAFEGCSVLGKYFQDHLKAKVATIDRQDPVFTNRLFAYRFINSTRRDLHLELSDAAQVEDRTASAFAYIAMDLTSSPLVHLREVMRSLQRRDVRARDIGKLLANFGFLGRAAYWRYAKDQIFVPRDVDLDLMICVEQLPNVSNRIRLAENSDRLGIPKALLEWSPMPADEQTFRSTVRHLRSFWARFGLDRICPLRFSPEASDEASSIIERAEACAHPSGSTRMGVRAWDSVVGPDLRCHAIPNVSIASASVFPTAGSANPTMTIMATALWLADSYLERQSAQKAPLSNRALQPA